MTDNLNVFVPNDIGQTIKLGVKEPNKFDVDTDALGVPTDQELAAVSTSVSNLTQELTHVNTTVDNLSTTVSNLVDNDVSQEFAVHLTANDPHTQYLLKSDYRETVLSPDSGNLLENRDNGLYYGIEAPPDVYNLYVDSHSGDDSNSGSRASPLKTISRALNMQGNDKNGNIWLKVSATDTGTTPLVYPYTDLRTITGRKQFRPYGHSKIDGQETLDIQARAAYYPLIRGDVPKPVILIGWKVMTTVDGDYIRPCGMFPSNGGSSEFYGLTLKVAEWNDPTYGVPSSTTGTIGFNVKSIFYPGDYGTVQLYGCIVIDTGWDAYANSTPSRTYLWVSAHTTQLPTVILNKVDWRNGNNVSITETSPNRGYGALGMNEAKMIITAGDGDNAISPTETDIINQYGITTMNSNTAIILKHPGFVSGMVRHSSGVVLNVQTNIEL